MPIQSDKTPKHQKIKSKSEKDEKSGVRPSELCRHCEKPLTGQRRKYCSDFCYFEARSKILIDKYHNYRNIKKVQESLLPSAGPTLCLVCDPPRPVIGRSKYCSDECKKLARTIGLAGEMAEPADPS